MGDDRSGRTGRDLAWVSSTYFAEGLPWSVLHQISGEYLTAIGASATQVGRTSYLHLALVLKFAWSPIVDLFGTLRRWMVATQVVMGIGMGLLATLAHRIATGSDPANADTTWIWITMFAIGVLSAMHDIACDGYYMDALDKDRQASYSGARTAAFRTAMLVGSSALVFIGGRVSWLAGFGTAAVIMVGLGMAHRTLLPHGHGEDRDERVSKEEATGREDRWGHFKAAYLSFLRQDKVVVVILFILFYKIADVMMFNMSKVLLARELGVPTDVRGVLNTLAIGGQIAGAIIGGAWIGRRSLSKTLWSITLLMALTEPLYIGLAALAPTLALSIPGTAGSMADIDMLASTWKLATIGVVIVIEQVCGGLATVAQMIFIMRRCHPDHKAAHYAFATAIYSVAQMVVGGESGQLFEAVGSVRYFSIISLLTIPAVVLARFVPKD